jgi:hypothetical protein
MQTMPPLQTIPSDEVASAPRAFSGKRPANRIKTVTT